MTARRPVAEAAIARVVAATDHARRSAGVGVVGLLTGDATAAGVPHVVGVRTDAGEDLRADLVVDAAGRRSTLPTWLTDIGAQPPVEERADCGFVYYGRHFRSNDGSVPMAFGPLLQEYGTVSVLTLPADNGTWGVGIIASAKDKAMRSPQGPRRVDQRGQEHAVVRALARRRAARRPGRRDGQDRRPAPFVRPRRPAGSPPGSSRWPTRGPARIRRWVAGSRSARSMRPPCVTCCTTCRPIRWRCSSSGTRRRWRRRSRGTGARSRSTRADWLRSTPLLEGRTLEPTPAVRGRQGVGGRRPARTPRCCAPSSTSPACLALPEEVLGRPGVFERVIELGSGWRDEQLPGPSREELVALVAP